MLEASNGNLKDRTNVTVAVAFQAVRDENRNPGKADGDICYEWILDLGFQCRVEVTALGREDGLVVK